MKFPNEMKKLRTLLDEMCIKWQDASHIMPQDEIERGMKMLGVLEMFVDSTIYRTHFDVDGIHYSVICGYGTYGGEEGLLEMMIGCSEPTGWLTAEDIIGQIQERIKEMEMLS